MLNSPEYATAVEISADLLDLLHQDESDQDDSSDTAFGAILQRVLKALGSPLGFCGYLDEEGDLVCASMEGEVFAACQVEGKALRFPRAKWGGLWGQVLLERRSLFRNGTHLVPPGHLEIHRSLGAPIIYRDELVGSIHVANREEDYTDRDREFLEQVLRPLAPAIRSRLRQRSASELVARSISDLELAVNAEREARTASLQSLRELQKLHQQILDGTPAVVYVKDLAGRYQFINRRYEDSFHVRREEFLGQTDFDLFPAAVAQQFRLNDIRVAETELPVKSREIAQHDDGPHTYISIKFPLRDAQGQVCSVAGISTEITEQALMEQELARLSRQRELILDAIGDGVVGIDAQGVTTFVNPMATSILGWKPVELIGRTLSSCVGRNVMPLELDVPDGQAEVVLEDEEARFLTKSGDSIQVRYISHPLIVEGESIGAVITFRSLMDEQARQAAERQQSLAENRRIEEERQLRSIRSLQLDLFPHADPLIAGYDIGGGNFPQRIVSGDFFDYIPQPDGSLIVIVGDATGHDLTSAVHMVEAHAVLHTLLDCGIPLNEMLFRLNQTLCRHLSGRFVSLFVLRLDPLQHRIEFAGAGHDATLLRASGKVESLQSTGLVLGLEPAGRQPTFASAKLDPGDLVLLLTDGYQEATSTDNKLFGRKRIFDAAKAGRGKSIPDLIAGLNAEVERFRGPLVQQDDMTAVVIRRRPL